MSYDLECPYCEAQLDICHDDGFGYAEGIKHEMECGKCGKNFVFETSISFYYEPEKADCLNDGKHDFKPTHTAPKCYTKMQCSMCEAERDLTTDERNDLNIPTVEEYIQSLNLDNKKIKTQC